MTAVLLVPALAADAPRWRMVNGQFSDFKISADPRISRNPQLVPILRQTLSRFESEARKEDASVHEEPERPKKKGTVWPQRGSYTETFSLLGMTERYVAFFEDNTICSVGAARCYSSEHATIYRLRDWKQLKIADVLALDTQAQRLHRLAVRDEEVTIERIRPAGQARADNNDNGEVSLGVRLNIDDTAPADGVVEYLKSADIGFTTDVRGRLTTLDIYLPNDEKGGHTRAYRWSIDVADAAPLLAPELRDLIGAPATR